MLSNRRSALYRRRSRHRVSRRDRRSRPHGRRRMIHRQHRSGRCVRIDHRRCSRRLGRRWRLDYFDRHLGDRNRLSTRSDRRLIRTRSFHRENDWQMARRLAPSRDVRTRERFPFDIARDWRSAQNGAQGNRAAGSSRGLRIRDRRDGSRWTVTMMRSQRRRSRRCGLSGQTMTGHRPNIDWRSGRGRNRQLEVDPDRFVDDRHGGARRLERRDGAARIAGRDVLHCSAAHAAERRGSINEHVPAGQ